VKTSGIGRVIFWGGGNLWIGLSVGAVDLHAHHAIQIAVGFDGPVEFRQSPRDEWVRYSTGALIQPGAPHEFQAPGRRIANILYEPETSLGRALLERYPAGPIVGLQASVDKLSEAYDAGSSDARIVEETMAFLADLARTEVPGHPTDQRILRVVDWVARHIDQPLTLGAAAEVAHLSEGRFRHLFVEETGVAFRPYVLWTRLNRALELGFGGTSWTEAAHATNFADSAHLTRTCRRMYGLNPSSIRIEGAAGKARQAS
jgi:AraC-like DNA-binding protein